MVFREGRFFPGPRPSAARQDVYASARAAHSRGSGKKKKDMKTIKLKSNEDKKEITQRKLKSNEDKKKKKIKQRKLKSNEVKKKAKGKTRKKHDGR